MTLKGYLLTANLPDESEPLEDLPDELFKDLTLDEPIDKAEAADIFTPRHLSLGSESLTLCGAAKIPGQHAHPSKATVSDCPTCREAWRECKALMKAKVKALTEKAFAEAEKAKEAEIKKVEAEKTAAEKTAAEKTAAEKTTAEAAEKTTAEAAEKTSLIEWVNTEPVTEPVVVVVTEPAPVTEPVIKPVTEPTIVGPAIAVINSAWHPTAEDVQRVKALRAGKNEKGRPMTYEAIEGLMNWPKMHGCRPWKICMGQMRPKKGEN